MTDTNSDSLAAKASRRIAYTLAAGAAASTAATASADISYSGPQDISIAQFSAVNLNLDGDAYADMLLKNYVFLGGNYQGALVNFAPGRMVGFSLGLSYASALQQGDLIDATTTGSGPFQGSLAYGSGNPNAEFNSVTDAYIGLEFPINGLSHFGWIRVDIDNAAGTFVVRDWAYNTDPGAGLLAGQVPEPSTLGMLAAGALGVAALRRRRSTNQ